MSNYPKPLSMKDLVGREILSAKINPDKDLVLLETTTGPLYLTWEGDCCAQCFLANASGVSALEGSTVLKAESAEWKNTADDNDCGDVTESMGTKIKTTKGYVTLESRVVHNGYYGGSLYVSDTPRGQYGFSRPLGEKDIAALKKLEDF